MTRVLTVGCFDLLHIGHVTQLRAAKLLGDWLIVGLTADEAVGKGPGRPAFPYIERYSMLTALRCIDQVFMHYDAEKSLRQIRPDIYVKGAEYEGRLPEQELAESLGIKVVFLPTFPVYSSTALLTGAYLNDRIRSA